MFYCSEFVFFFFSIVYLNWCHINTLCNLDWRAEIFQDQAESVPVKAGWRKGCSLSDCAIQGRFHLCHSDELFFSNPFFAFLGRGGHLQLAQFLLVTSLTTAPRVTTLLSRVTPELQNMYFACMWDLLLLHTFTPACFSSLPGLGSYCLKLDLSSGRGDASFSFWTLGLVQTFR